MTTSNGNCVPLEGAGTFLVNSQASTLMLLMMFNPKKRYYELPFGKANEKCGDNYEDAASCASRETKEESGNWFLFSADSLRRLGSKWSISWVTDEHKCWLSTDNPIRTTIKFFLRPMEYVVAAAVHNHLQTTYSSENTTSPCNGAAWVSPVYRRDVKTGKLSVTLLGEEGDEVKTSGFFRNVVLQRDDVHEFLTSGDWRDEVLQET